MDGVTDFEGWRPFMHPRFKLRFSYPTVTPLGHEVDRTEDQRDGAARVHLRSRGSNELYFELLHVSDLTPEEEYARHKPYLEQRFGAGSVTELSEASLGQLPAWTYAFRWDQGERSVLLLPVGQDAYRVLFDPRSPLNATVLETIAVVA